MDASRRKLIVVSNRGPVSYRRDDDGVRSARRGGGGLVTALGPLVSRHSAALTGLQLFGALYLAQLACTTFTGRRRLSPVRSPPAGHLPRWPGAPV